MNRFRFSNVSSRVRGYLELMRPANIVTAFADILAGFAAAGGVLFFNYVIDWPSPEGLPWLLVSTFGLYGGGVVLNDVFDATLDAKERPERAIPSGRVSKNGATVLGVLLLLLGVLAAYRVNIWSGIIALSVAFGTIIYDGWAKRSVRGGPLVMGFCRGGNLLLGCSIQPSVIVHLWYLALIPIVYITSITLISRGEVHGGERGSGLVAVGLIALVICSLLILGLLPAYSLVFGLPFLLLFIVAVIPPFLKAALDPSPPLIRRAVKRGVLSQIILDSTLAAGFGSIILGIATLVLLFVSIIISKLFSVT